MRDAAGEFDDLDATFQLAKRVRVGLAVLAGDFAGDLVGMLVQQFGELEHDRRPLHRCQGAPGRLRLLGVLDGGVEFGDRGKRHLADFLAGRRIEHR